jgi:hypothetical protein
MMDPKTSIDTAHDVIDVSRRERSCFLPFLQDPDFISVAFWHTMFQEIQ